MTQRTIIIILLAAILSIVGIISSIQIAHHKEEQRIKAEIQKAEQEKAARWQKECKEIEASGWKLEGDYKCE